jgi:heat shock protein HtpX
MGSPLDFNKYVTTAADWRGALQSNSRRTYLVIGLFFAIYIALGLLVDMFIYAEQFPAATIPQLFNALITFKLTPYATFVMVGVAALSILVTFTLSDKLMLLGTEYREITSDTAKDDKTGKETQLYNVVEEMKIAAGLGYMPKVFVIEADYMNAFASGYSEKSAMVAITRGLMEKLTRSELQAVMAHELSHIRHMDIKLTLMASILANLMLMVLDIFFYSALFSDRGDSRSDSRNKLAPFIILLRYLLPVINIVLLMYLSRRREYMADAGCVQLTRDNQPLISALLKIQNDHATNKDAYATAYQRTPHENVRREAYIFDPIQAGFEPMSSIADMFSTHPNLQDRLAALGYKINQQP